MPVVRNESLPPPRWIAATLRSTTETLMRELVRPTDRPPEWSDAEWRVAQAVAAIHGISPLLSHSLQWQGPPRWQAFLHDQHMQTQRRHLRIEALLDHIDAAARHAMLSVVALKGAELHRRGLYRAGERPMSDIDLLVAPREREAACRVIESLHYEFAYETSKHVVFHPRGGQAAASIGEHADNPLKIELHTSIHEELPIARCDISDLILARDGIGLNGYRSAGAMMAHVLLHASANMTFRGLRALHLQDVLRVARRMSDSDWGEVMALDRDGRFWWASPILAIVERYVPGTIPPIVLATAQRSCHWVLRSSSDKCLLADVSLSNPRIYAFTGLGWMRSPGEAARFMLTRLRPSKETLAMRKKFSDYQSLGADSAWVQQSQFERIVHWVFSRPMRVETMASVRAALNAP
jgi:hypothetical protein